MSAPALRRLALLDDYGELALHLAPWERLPAGLAVQSFPDHLADEDALAGRLAPFDALVAMRERTRFPRSLIERLPNLHLLVTTGLRNASIDLAACAERGVTVCGAPGAGAPTTDLTWALILALARHLPAQQQGLREGRWQAAPPGLALEGATLGVIGLGRLGSRVAAVGAAFGMRVLAWSPNLTQERARAAGAELVERDALLRASDVVTLHLVLSERSRGTIGAAELALMRPTAYLVNSARSGLVDSAALVAALHEGRIAGAGLDVYDVEPLPRDDPLLTAPNTVLTPHLGYVTDENMRAFYASALEAVLAYCAGTPVNVLA